jgi:hypothetical protein
MKSIMEPEDELCLERVGDVAMVIIILPLAPAKGCRMLKIALRKESPQGS